MPKLNVPHNGELSTLIAQLRIVILEIAQDKKVISGKIDPHLVNNPRHTVW